jgi:4'-phosphopantetheinyl transferase
MFSLLPDRLTLSDAQIDAWILPVCSLTESQAAELLSPGELAKGRRFHFQKDRDLSWNARAALRILLGKYLGVPAPSVGFVYTDRGRPVLAAGHAEGGIQFSVSHAGTRVAIAVAHGPVGIDIEQAGRQVDAAVSGGQPDFLRQWTRMEAYLKATGAGLGDTMSARPDSSWIFFDISDHEYAGAIATRIPRAECRIYRLEWRGGQLQREQGSCLMGGPISD